MSRKMNRADSMKLPNEALKAILAFMTRKQLIALSALNRQLAYIVQAPPFATKPLLRPRWTSIRAAYCEGCHSSNCGHKGTEVNPFGYDYRLWGYTERRGVELDSILYPKWLRFRDLYLLLPNDVEMGREWLKLLDANSHCLMGCEHLSVRYFDAVLTPLIEKFKPMVKRMGTVHIH